MATTRKKLTLPRFIPLLLGTAVLALLLLAGCGGTNGAASSGGASTQSAQQTQKTTDKTKPSSVEIDPCSLVTKAEVEQALGVGVGQPEKPPEAPFSCRYTGEKGQGLAVLVVLVRPGTTKSAFESVKEQFPGAENVSGAGDDAFFIGNQLNVLKGDTYLNVGGDASLEALQSLTQKALGRLP